MCALVGDPIPDPKGTLWAMQLRDVQIYATDVAVCLPPLVMLGAPTANNLWVLALAPLNGTHSISLHSILPLAQIELVGQKPSGVETPDGFVDLGHHDFAGAANKIQKLDP